MGKTGDYHVKQNKTNIERQLSGVFAHMQKFNKKLKIEKGVLGKRKRTGRKGEREKDKTWCA
jgi:hypothetical protein